MARDGEARDREARGDARTERSARGAIEPVASASGRARFVALALLFVVSGGAALGVEVVWARALHRLLGSTSMAVAGVLASFLLGLGAGAFVADRLLSGVRRPLAAYGLCELVALAGTLGLTAFLPRAHPLLGLPGADLWPLLLVAVAVLPCGATLPFAVAAFFADRGRLASRLRILYGLNALGGGAGALGVALIALPRLGEWGTALACGAAQAAVAGGAILLARAGPARPARVPVATAPFPGDAPAARGAVLLAALVVFASGFVVLYWEVLWTRILTLTVGGTLHAFAVVTAAVVIGIGCGSLAGRGAWLWRNSGWALPLLAAALLAAGYGVVERLPEIYLLGVRRFDQDPLLWGSATAALVAFLPSFVLGGLFPWAAGRFPRRVGRLAAVNAAGCVAGALAAGPLLAPYLTLEVSYRLGFVAVVLLALPGTLLAGRARAGEAPRPLGAGKVAVVTLITLLVAAGGEFALRAVAGPRWDPRRLVSGVYQWPRADLESVRLTERERDREILSLHRGREVIVTIEKEEAANTLYVRGNGKVEGSVPLERAAPSIADMPTQVLLGDLPLALLPADAQPRVLVIGLGSGVTLGSLEHAGGRRLRPGAVDVIEIEEAYRDALATPPARRYLEGIVPAAILDGDSDAADDPWRFHFGDARRLLEVELRDERWDAIISQPSEPWIPAAASLFTAEFFRVAAARLEENGVFLQWLQFYKIEDDALRTLVRTFRAAFDEVHMARPPATGELILIGSHGGVRLERLLEAPLGPLLIAARLESPLDRLAILVAGPRGVDRWVREGEGLPIHVDDRPDLTLALTRSLYRRGDLASENLERLRAIAAGDPLIEYLPEAYRTNAPFREELAERNRHFGDDAEAAATER